MPTIYVYNNNNDSMEVYYRSSSEPMPYNTGNTLTVGEFRANSKSSIIWTTRSTMESWNSFRRYWGQSIYVGYVFKRIWEGGHAAQSQHYAGTALDIGQNLEGYTLERLRDAAYNSGVWSYVEPASLAPTWVHVDKRMGPPACSYGGYPAVGYGSAGVYVLVLQDALNALGYTGSGLDGYFGRGTLNALIKFQSVQGLTADGIANCETWNSITEQAVGIGQTSTVVNP
jgi:hypothetical protein